MAACGVDEVHIHEMGKRVSLADYKVWESVMSVHWRFYFVNCIPPVRAFMKPRVARHSERAGDLRRVFLSASCARAVGHSAPSESLPLSFADRARGASRSALLVIGGGRFVGATGRRPLCEKSSLSVDHVGDL